MATDAEIMEQALGEGKTLVEALALVDAPAPVTAPAGDGLSEAAPGAAEPRAALAADDLAPYLERIPEELRDLVRPALADVIAQARAKTAGATDAEAQLAAMHKAFSTNPQGALAFLAEHYKVPLRLADQPEAAPAPAAPQPDADLDAEIASLKSKIGQATTMAEVADLTDRMTTLKVTRGIGDAVRPVAAAQLSQEEQRQIDRLRQDNPDIPVDTLMPQIRRRQAALRERPYLTPEEGMWIELGPALAQQVKRLRGQVVRAVSPAERVAAGTSGPSSSAPVTLGSLDLNSLSEKQIMALMQATGGVAPER